MGLTVDLSGAGIGLGVRTTRYALVLDDLVVKYLGVRVLQQQIHVECITDRVLDRLSPIPLRSLTLALRSSSPRSEPRVIHQLELLHHLDCNTLALKYLYTFLQANLEVIC